jgi:selenocysteine lyase/cysteine desulfurase
VVCTATDHNSILRPIHAMAERGWVTQTLVPVDPATGMIDPADVRRAIRPDTKLIAMTHASNVTGAVQPLRAIGRIARECAVPFVVDAAQSAGHVPIDVRADCVDLLAAPGHKALMGPLGTGFLYVRPGLEKHLRPLREGGTGSQSELPVQPTTMPDKFECGSHNAPGLFGLAAGVEWTVGQTVEALHARQSDLAAAFVDGVSAIKGLTCYGPRGVADRIGVFSVRVDGFAPTELSAALEDDFGILTRPGLHCAPHIHAALGTVAGGGTTRFSFGPFTSVGDVRYVTDALAQVAATRVGV